MDVDQLIRKIKYLRGASSDRELAGMMGMSPQSFNNRKKRGTLEKSLRQWIAEQGLEREVVAEAAAAYGTGDSPAGLSEDEALVVKYLRRMQEDPVAYQDTLDNIRLNYLAFLEKKGIA